MHWYESFICVQKLSEFPCSNRIAPLSLYIPVRYGAITALNRCENYVLHTTMFLEKLPFCLETAVPVSCLPRVICQHVKFNLTLRFRYNKHSPPGITADCELFVYQPRHASVANYVSQLGGPAPRGAWLKKFLLDFHK